MKENEKEEEGEVEDKMKRRNLGVVAHSFDPSTQKTGRMVSRIKASLVHIVSSRSVRTIQPDLSNNINNGKKTMRRRRLNVRRGGERGERKKHFQKSQCTRTQQACARLIQVHILLSMSPQG